MNEVSVSPLEAPRNTRGRLRHAVMEAGVVLSLTFAIVAVICAFGLDGAGASELHGTVAVAGRVTVGAALLSVFAGMCVLTTFMLRNTSSRAALARSARRGTRQG
ncbi:hypothetical protein [Ancylobacter lacus]|uniref:hypothetical protein n=1 Tax=Ancylobacter lacus TaxID=2579970 RepID=UPI001BD089E0|nr:hypothetical protein [Ancylobacter lacus]MBS7538077.1 hypothetical protein [Ancylobacter lacus]